MMTLELYEKNFLLTKEIDLNQFGSVRNLKDRRKDIFELKKR